MIALRVGDDLWIQELAVIWPGKRSCWLTETPEKVGLGDGWTVDALGTGNVHLKMPFKVSQSKKVIMYNVLYITQLACNLFSVRTAASKGKFIKFGQSRYWIWDTNGKLHGMGTLVDNLYWFDCEAVHTEAANLTTTPEDSSLDVWNFRLWHASEQSIKDMAYKRLATGIRLLKWVKLWFCEGCMHLSDELKNHLKSKGIHHQLTVPYSHQQNGISERMNRTLMETAQSIMAHAGLPDRF